MERSLRDKLFDDLEYDFLHRWRGHVEALGESARIPDPLWAALKARFADDFNVAVVHPVGQAVVVHFDPPSTTTFDTVGSLVGGEYKETVTLDAKGQMRIEGVFKHPRLREHFHVTLEPQ